METPKAVDDLWSRLIARFSLETWIPVAISAVSTWAIVLTMNVDLGKGSFDKDPSRSPIQRLGDRVADLTLRDYVIFLVATGIAGLVIGPFQFAMLQAAEGYETGRLSARLFRPLTTRHRLVTLKLADLARGEDQGLSQEAAEAAARKIRRYPSGAGQADEAVRVMPTTFGNVLRTGEDRAGERYGLRVDVAIPRLLHHVDDGNRRTLEAHRAAMELGINLSFLMVGVAILATAAFASWPPQYLAVPAALYGLAYTSYLGAIRSAEGYVHALAVLIDLHRFDLLDGARMPRPTTHEEEQASFRLLCALFDRHDDQPSLSNLVYEHPARSSPDDQKS